MRLRAKRHDRTGRPVVCRFCIKPRTCDFHIFSYFVAVGSFTADGGLLQPTGGVKTTPHKTNFAVWISTRNFRTGQKLNNSGTVTTLELVTRSAERKAQQCVKWPKTLGKSVSVVDANAWGIIHWRSFVFRSLSSLLSVSVIIPWLFCLFRCKHTVAQVWVFVHPMVIFMIHACCERCFWSLRLLHSLHLLPHHLLDHPAVPTARNLRTLAPWPRTSLPQVMSPTTTSSQRLMSNTPRSPRASSGSLVRSIVIAMFHAQVEWLSLRPLHPPHFPSLHLLYLPALPSAFHLPLPWCRGLQPRALPLRSWVPRTKRTPPQVMSPRTTSSRRLMSSSPRSRAWSASHTLS